jgi:hypothetical protein
MKAYKSYWVIRPGSEVELGLEYYADLADAFARWPEVRWTETFLNSWAAKWGAHVVVIEQIVIK